MGIIQGGEIYSIQRLIQHDLGSECNEVSTDGFGDKWTGT